MNKLQIVEVTEKIEEFMNYGMKYIVWYKVWPVFGHEDIRAVFCKSMNEAIQVRNNLKNKINHDENN